MRKFKLPSAQEIQDYFLNLPILKQLIEWTKTHSLPGFFDVPIYDVVIFVYNEIRRYDLFTRANAIAFSFFIALLPSLIMLFTLLPLFQKSVLNYLPEGETFDHFLYKEIQKVMPGAAGQSFYQFVDEIVSTTQFELFSFGFILAIYFSSNGMLAMMRGFEKSYDKTFKRRGGLKKRMVAVGLTFLLGGLLFAAFVLIIIGNILINWLDGLLPITGFSRVSLTLLRWLAIILIYYVGIGVIYRFGAPMIRKFKIFSPGVTLAVILSLLTSLAFSIYIDRFGRFESYYKVFYGSFAAIIVVLLWIQLNALILLIGFELNASIAVNRDLKEQLEDEEGD